MITEPDADSFMLFDINSNKVKVSIQKIRVFSSGEENGEAIRTYIGFVVKKEKEIFVYENGKCINSLVEYEEIKEAFKSIKESIEGKELEGEYTGYTYQIKGVEDVEFLYRKDSIRVILCSSSVYTPGIFDKPKFVKTINTFIFQDSSKTSYLFEGKKCLSSNKEFDFYSNKIDIPEEIRFTFDKIEKMIPSF